jgi:hypothetical protein
VEPGNSISIVSGYGLDGREIKVQSMAEAKLFPLTFVSRPGLGFTLTLVQWVPGVLFPGVKRSMGVTLTSHPHLVPMSRMSRSYTSSSTLHLHRCVVECLCCFYFPSIVTQMRNNDKLRNHLSVCRMAPTQRNFTERRGRVVNTPTSYSGGPGFKSPSRNSLS